MASENPLLIPSTLPYGLPDYAAIAPEHYLPAFEEAFRVHRAEIAEITSNPDPATFENTLVALERSGELLGTVARTFYTVTSADGTPEIEAIQAELAPKMSAHSDAITFDAALYARVQAVHEAQDTLDLDDESRYLLERHYREMTLAGAGLSDEQKERVSSLNQRLSVLTTQFEKNLLADTNDLAVHFTDAADLTA